MNNMFVRRNAFRRLKGDISSAFSTKSGWLKTWNTWSWRPSGLRRKSAATWLLGPRACFLCDVQVAATARGRSFVQSSPTECVCVCVRVCVLTVCDLETSQAAKTRVGLLRLRKTRNITCGIWTKTRGHRLMANWTIVWRYPACGHA